jgi:hypothetical protein
MIERRSGLVIQPTIGRDDAATVCGLLHGISRAAGTPDDIRAAATYWASAVDPEMERGDLQTVAWLLATSAPAAASPPPSATSPATGPPTWRGACFASVQRPGWRRPCPRRCAPR